MSWTVEQLLEIGGNLAAYEELATLLRGGDDDVIGFVGAGASAESYPLWSELIDGLADYAVEKGRAEKKDTARWKAMRATPQEQVDRIRRSLGEAHYRDYLHKTFTAPVGAGGRPLFTSTHAALMTLPFRG